MNRKRFSGTFINKDTVPPRYAALEAGSSTSAPADHSAPPPYYLEPIRFPVGGKVPKDSFVTVPQLKTHLGLLRAFRELKDRVIDLDANQDVRDKLPPLAQELGPQERWTWFLELALERCELHNLAPIRVSLNFSRVGFTVGFRSCPIFSSRTTLSIILPWTYGSSGMRTC